jgi:hypothetical protein
LLPPPTSILNKARIIIKYEPSVELQRHVVVQVTILLVYSLYLAHILSVNIFDLTACMVLFLGYLPVFHPFADYGAEVHLGRKEK